MVRGDLFSVDFLSKLTCEAKYIIIIIIIIIIINVSM